jgi:hypothetical protein
LITPYQFYEINASGNAWEEANPQSLEVYLNNH